MTAPLEIVFSFDTTGSMYSWLDEIRGRLQDLIQRLQADLPAIKIAVFAHGDYCDARSSYVTKFIDFTTDAATLCDFVRTVERTGGGDTPECYELVLREVRTKLSWSHGSRRVLVLIGDAEPHEADYRENKDKIDWKVETQALAGENVIVYGVQCGSLSGADAFYQTISLVTGGKHLRLADMASLFDLMVAVCYREGADTSDLLTGYEKEVMARSGPTGMARDIGAIFATLKDTNGGSDSLATEPTITLLKKTSSLTKLKKPKSVVGGFVHKPKPGKKTTCDSTKKEVKRIGSKRINEKLVKSGVNVKFRQANLPLLKRENVPENNFALRTMKWCPWRLAIAEESDIPSDRFDLYSKRSTGAGYRLQTLSSGKPSKPGQLALFEVAVQGPGIRRRLHVVYSSFSRRCLGDARWESRLLRKAGSQVDKALARGFKIFVRFFLVEKPGMRSAVRRYDYAWKSCRSVRSGPRPAMKAGLVISQ